MYNNDVHPHFGYLPLPDPAPEFCSRCGRVLERVRAPYEPRVAGRLQLKETLECPAFVEKLDHWCKPWYTCHGTHGHDAFVVADLGPDPDEKSITCPQCGRTSYNPNDVAMKYCAHCRQWHDRMEVVKQANKKKWWQF